jgi:NNP family nitrate/nitrite transporter-like MFS transporter
MARAAITHWEPDDERFWAQSGRKVARRNLTWSVFAEFLGFSVWLLWSVTAVKLSDAGFDFTTGQLFWLVSIPGLVGATLRFPYTFAPGRFGGRRWTVISALLLLIPAIGLAVAVTNPETPYWLFLLLAATAGFGGGNFSSSMANISFFYPDKHKGAALGLNAAGGNVGVAVVQKLVPWVVGGGLIGGAIIGGPTGQDGLYLQNAGLVFVPLILFAALMAWRRMDNLAEARSSVREQAQALRRRYCWIITVLYVGAFGSFIGYSAALPLVIKTQFTDVDPLSYAFLGPLVGSLARPFGGWLSDRIGGARVTLLAFAGMTATTTVMLATLASGSFAAFLATMMVLFVLSGMANGSVFRMVPPIARRAALDDAGDGEPARRRALAIARRDTAAVIGFSAAVAAYGGFVIPEGFKRSIEATGQIDAAFYGFLAYYATCMGVTWWFFVRRSFAVRWAPSLADVRA